MEEEFSGPPMNVVLELVVGLFLCMWAGLAVPGKFLSIHPHSDENRLMSTHNIPSIWDVGDVTNRMNLTPVALMEAICFAKTAFEGQPTKPDHSNVPCAVFWYASISAFTISHC